MQNAETLAGRFVSVISNSCVDRIKLERSSVCSSSHGSNHKMELAEATAFLESLIEKTLHITVSDGRLFVGAFKCTDNESNVILSNSFEYRMPTETARETAISSATESGHAKAAMSSRFVGLIVIPGFRIQQIQLESHLPQPLPTANTTTTSSNLAVRSKS